MNVEVDKYKNIHRIEFSSLLEFYRYMKDTETNMSFKNERLASMQQDDYKTKWTGTESFEHACTLFKDGWTEMTERLNNRLNVQGRFEQTMTSRNVKSVQGFHPIVPLYLMGIPENMVTKKMIPMKQKVVTLDKSISYSCGVKQDKIIEESVKAFRLIQKLESQNYRVNLNLVLGAGVSYSQSQSIFVKIKLKSANEKLNISKLSFPLVHPSMLRRLMLRFIEVYPDIVRGFIHGYGTPLQPDTMRAIWPNDILLPQFINKEVEKINTLDDLENL